MTDKEAIEIGVKAGIASYKEEARKEKNEHDKQVLHNVKRLRW